MVGVVFGNYHVLPNFLVVLWLMLMLRLGFGCDKTKFQNLTSERIEDLKNFIVFKKTKC